MRPDPTLPRQLPGVRFAPTSAAPEAGLPRMDIALFVGFAASGPLQAAVAVESLAEFETVFGTGIALAQGTESGTVLQGLLHPAVRGFFSQGGRRCWVLRVAGADARSSEFPLPCLLTAMRAEAGAPWQLEAASLPARSPGSGADTLQVAARMARTPLRVRAPQGLANRLQIRPTGTPQSAPRAGDVLCFEWGPLRQHVRVDAVTDGILQLGGSVGLLPLTGGPLPAMAGQHPVHSARWLAPAHLELSVRCTPHDLPQRQQVLQLAFAGSSPHAWMALDGVDIEAAPGPDGLLQARLVGQPWCLAPDTSPDPFTTWCASGSERLVQLLRLDLQTQDASGQSVLPDLGPGSRSAAGLEPSVFHLPTDDQLFAPQTGAGTTDAARGVAWRDAQGHWQGRFALASPASTPGRECLILPLCAMDAFDAALSARPTTLCSLERDGLADFSWTLFAEPTLAQAGADLLAEQAEALRAMGGRTNTPLPLHGIHAALGAWPAAFAQEPSLLVVPDAVHPGWAPIVPTEAPWTELAGLSEPVADAGTQPFGACAATPLARPRLVQGADPRSDGSFTLFWTAVDAADQYTVEESLEPGFGTASICFSGPGTQLDVGPRKPGQACYRVRAERGKVHSPWSAPVRVVVAARGYRALPWQEDTLLAIHRLMLRTAAARGDMLAVLALPRGLDTDRASRYAKRLCALRSDSDGGRDGAPPAIGEDETRALSHGALYHPWLMLRRDQEAIGFAPDGPVCGQLAAGALERGAWVALANRPLRDCVALDAPGLRPSAAQRQQLLDAQVNLLQSAPSGFVVASSDTLCAAPDWRPLNVRRLMCLLRRLALQRGQTYVFEPNGAVLQRTVQRGFEALLEQLYRRGALAGSAPALAYQVSAGADINTRTRRDAGQFWVELKVAPALPLQFLSVRLVRSGERVVSQEAH